MGCVRHLCYNTYDTNIVPFLIFVFLSFKPIIFQVSREYKCTLVQAKLCMMYVVSNEKEIMDVYLRIFLTIKEDVLCAIGFVKWLYVLFQVGKFSFC